MEGKNFDLMLSFGLSIFIAIISAILGYYLGVKQTKKQALSKYVTETAGKLYPALFSEMKEQLERLDNYLEKPNVNFYWRELDEVYNSGLERFIEKHHKNLFFTLDSFHKKIFPKFTELTKNFMDLWNNMSVIWSNYLEKTLPSEAANESRNIAHDLSKSTNPYYIIPDLLNERNEEARKKIEACILQKTSQMYLEKTRKPYVIKGQMKLIDFDEISHSLIEEAKPRITKVITTYRELKKLSDREVKLKLLPLLQECISNPL